MTNQPSQSKEKNRYPKRKDRPGPQDRRDLQVEIGYLRQEIDCLSELIDEERPLNEQMRLLDVLSKVIVRLAGLIKAQKALGQSSDDYLAGLNRMLEEAYEKLSREGVHK